MRKVWSVDEKELKIGTKARMKKSVGLKKQRRVWKDQTEG